MQWGRSPGKNGSHFDPDSDLFLPKEKKDVVTSTACWTAMAALLVCLNFVIGPIQMLKLYGIPYWVCIWRCNCNYIPLFPRVKVFIRTFSLRIADICNVVGLCDLLASPWPWRQAPLVPWKGMQNLLHQSLTLRLRVSKCFSVLLLKHTGMELPERRAHNTGPWLWMDQ